MTFLNGCRVLAILRGHDPERLRGFAAVLHEAGIPSEVSLTSIGALDIIASLDGAGAGTVLTREQARDSVAAGATFLVTPATLPEVIDEGRRLGVPVLAGAYTPTEAVAAWRSGADAVKIFPCPSPGYLSALRDPLPDIPFVPVGGVQLDQAREYLERGAVAVGIGGPLVGGVDIDGLRARLTLLRGL